MKRVGERIRQKRELSGFPLYELAQRVGITSSALSQIEKGKSFPSILTLKSIADNLHSSVGELIGENEYLSNHPVLRLDEARLIGESESGTKYYHLSQREGSGVLDGYLFVFCKGSSVGNFFANCAGYCFLHVISGTLVLRIEGREFFIAEGDSITLSAKSSFDIINTECEQSKVVCVLSSPKI